MTDPHDSEEHERLLRRVAAGDVARDDEAVRALAAACPKCAAELAELDALAARLDRAAAAEREALDEARAGVTDEDARLARALAPGARRRRSARWWGVAAAVVLAGATVLVWLRVGDARGPERHFLGESDARALAPVGRVTEYGEFAWDWALGPGESFTLLAWNAGEPEPVVRVSRLQSSSWTPSADVLAALGDEIRWEVRLVGPTGELVDSAQAYASRSR